MKSYINNQEISVTQQNNKTVKELIQEVQNKEMRIPMSMYSNNEQVGPLNKTYPREDKQMTTHNGDIVLYNGNQLVVFYRPNTWSYTILGKMNLNENEIKRLLSNGNVEIKLSK